MISVNFRDPRPIYEQIKDNLRRLIVSGLLPTGSKLPSVREMASDLAINPSTIQRAYRELEDLIENKSFTQNIKDLVQESGR